MANSNCSTGPLQATACQQSGSSDSESMERLVLLALSKWDPSPQGLWRQTTRVQESLRSDPTAENFLLRLWGKAPSPRSRPGEVASFSPQKRLSLFLFKGSFLMNGFFFPDLGFCGVLHFWQMFRCWFVVSSCCQVGCSVCLVVFLGTLHFQWAAKRRRTSLFCKPAPFGLKRRKAEGSPFSTNAVGA